MSSFRLGDRLGLSSHNVPADGLQTVTIADVAACVAVGCLAARGDAGTFLVVVRQSIAWLSSALEWLCVVVPLLLFISFFIGLFVLIIYCEVDDRRIDNECRAEKEKARTEERHRRRRELAAARGAAVALPLEREERLAVAIREVADYPHYSNLAWVERYARQNTRLLLRRADTIRERDRNFHAKRNSRVHDGDSTSVAVDLKKHAPEMYARHRWKVAALAIAEQVAVEPTKAARPRSRKKETREEYAARRARHEQHVGQVETARMLARLAVEKDAETRIAHEFPDLDEDARRQKVRAILEVYDKEETGHGTTL